MVTSTSKKILVAQAAAAATTAILKSHEERIAKKSRTPRRFRAFERTRRSVDDIYRCLGAKNFRQAYRMTYSSFRTLQQKLHDKIVEGINLQRHHLDRCPIGLCSPVLFWWVTLRHHVQIWDFSSWGILQAAMPRNIGIKKVIALVNALAKLHNFCIDEMERAAGVNVTELEAAADNDELNNTGEQDDNEDINQYDSNISDGYIELEHRGENAEESLIPIQLMDGGHHFDGMARTLRRNCHRETAGMVIPRTLLHDKVVESHMVRPTTNPKRK
jgi:hypothetical protein